MQYYLFDLDDDPYEIKNHYSNSKYESVVKELYSALDSYIANANPPMHVRQTQDQYAVWKDNNNYIVPWEDAEDGYKSSYPTSCGNYASDQDKSPKFMSKKVGHSLPAPKSAHHTDSTKSSSSKSDSKSESKSESKSSSKSDSKSSSLKLKSSKKSKSSSK